MYEPSFEEAYNCVTGHSSCEYGICSECSIYENGYDVEGVESNEKEN